MKKFTAKDILLPVISLLAICALATALLAFTNRVTAPRIAQLDTQKQMQSRRLVLPEAESFEDAEISVGGVTYSYAKGLDALGETVGYVFTTSGNGYGGEVSVMTGRDGDGKVVSIEVLDCSNETPRLGQNAKAPEFKGGFAGLSGVIEVVKGSPESGQIQAITGATITSKAVADAVNETLEIFNAVTGGETDG